MAKKEKKQINASLKGSRNERLVKKIYEGLGFTTIFRRVRCRSSQDLANLFDLAFVGRARHGFMFNKTNEAEPYDIAHFTEALANNLEVQLFVSSKTNVTITEKVIEDHIKEIRDYKNEHQLEGQYFLLAICYDSKWIGRGKGRHREPAHIENWLI